MKQIDFTKGNGLVPVVIQDNNTLQVLLLGYMNQETAIVEQINNLRSLKLSLEKDQRDLKESLIDSENSLAEVERNYKVDSVLYSKDIIAPKPCIWEAAIVCFG